MPQYWEPRDRIVEWAILHPRLVVVAQGFAVGSVLLYLPWFPSWTPVVTAVIAAPFARQSQQRWLRTYDAWKRKHANRYIDRRQRET